MLFFWGRNAFSIMLFLCLVSGIEFSFGIVVRIFCTQVSHKQWWRMQLTGTRTDLATFDIRIIYSQLYAILLYLQMGFFVLICTPKWQFQNFKGESDDKPICWRNNRFSDTHFLSHQVKYADGVTRNLVSPGYRWVTRWRFESLKIPWVDWLIWGFILAHLFEEFDNP